MRVCSHVVKLLYKVMKSKSEKSFQGWAAPRLAEDQEVLGGGSLAANMNSWSSVLSSQFLLHSFNQNEKWRRWIHTHARTHTHSRVSYAVCWSWMDARSKCCRQWVQGIKPDLCGSEGVRQSWCRMIICVCLLWCMRQHLCLWSTHVCWSGCQCVCLR